MAGRPVSTQEIIHLNYNRKERKMEDKSKICDLLLPALQATRNLHDLEDLEYIPEQEAVLATFASGATKKANVSMDSGTAMIRDIIAQIV